MKLLREVDIEKLARVVVSLAKAITAAQYSLFILKGWLQFFGKYWFGFVDFLGKVNRDRIRWCNSVV